jgi:hypothetical protein
LLNAPKGTRLYKRLKGENRLVKESTGDNTDFSLNFVPTMKQETLISGYKEILNTIYAPKHYYERIRTLLQEYKPKTKTFSLNSKRWSIMGFLNCMWFMGIRESGRRYYWRLVASTLFTRPKSFPLLISLSIYGYHFRRVVRKYINAPDTAAVKAG